MNHYGKNGHRLGAVSAPFSSSARVFAIAALLLAGAGAGGCSGLGPEQASAVSERRPSSTPAATTPRPSVIEGKPSGEKAKPVRIAQNPALSGRAPAEYGYGEKTDAQVMQEKPRAPRIGALGPMSGELKFFGVETSNGAELASDEINARGGIRNREFELLVYDTKGAIAGMRAGVEAFVKHNTVAIVGAATGEVSFAANKAINESQIIIISAGSRRRLGDTGPYNFRNTLDDYHAIHSLVGYIAKEKGWKRFALFSSVVNDYSIQLSAAFKAALLEHKLTITHELFLWSEVMSNINPEETSMAGQVAKMKENQPDAIIFTGDGKEAVDLVTEMRAKGVEIPLVGAEDLMVPEVVALGDLAAGALVYSGFDVDSKDSKVRAFVKNYTKRFGQPPSRLAALSYDAYYLLSAAIERAESLRPSHVRKALLSIKNFRGVTGTMSVGPSGEVLKEPFIFELKKKKGAYAFVSVKGRQ